MTTEPNGIAWMIAGGERRSGPARAGIETPRLVDAVRRIVGRRPATTRQATACCPAT